MIWLGIDVLCGFIIFMILSHGSDKSLGTRFVLVGVFSLIGVFAICKAIMSLTAYLSALS